MECVIEKNLNLMVLNVILTKWTHLLFLETEKFHWRSDMFTRTLRNL